MDYEKKYKEALERARQFSEKPYLEDSKGIVDYIFHELKESEDEKIRKTLIRFHKSTIDVDGIKGEDIIAWLEKQGEQKPAIEMKSAEESLGIDSDTYNKIVDECIYGEQKPAEFDDTNAKRMFIKALERVEEQNNKGYKLTDCDKNSWWEDFKAYTSCIIEQKPADKVERKGMNIVEEDMTPFQKKVFCIIDTTIEEEQGLKQVCDELLRLAHDEIMLNHTLSEEDEKILNLIIARLHSHPNVEAEEYGKDYHWFKSLKDRYTWKPSDEQMVTLEYYMHTLVCNSYKETLFSLYQDLKKLREK